MSSGLLVIARFRPVVDFASAHPAALGLSVDDVSGRYRGIDGRDPWPLDVNEYGVHLVEGLASLDQIELVRDYYELACLEWPCDLLFLRDEADAAEGRGTDSSFVLLGYDFGDYESEGSVFSVIYNEIIFGHYDELRQKARLLNKNLLFNTAEDAGSLGPIRTELLSAGVDLETSPEPEEMHSIAVYAP